MIKLIMKSRRIVSFSILVILLSCNAPQEQQVNLHLVPLMAGEIQYTQALLMARLTETDTLIDLDVPGHEGVVRFHYGTDSTDNLQSTNWITVDSAGDYIAKATLADLEPDALYHYQAEYGPEESITTRSEFQSFKTLRDPDQSDPVDFVMVTGSHFERFFYGGDWDTTRTISADKKQGFPAWDAIADLNPDFYIGNGDNVYYDHPFEWRAQTALEMRAKWHRLYFLPRFRNLLKTTPTYWLKDDHDYRWDDADTVAYSERYGSEPGDELGKEIFLEQVPLAYQNDDETYRTYRLSGDLQIWMLEGRDYRTPNSWPDTAGKTIWGEAQKQWLKETLAASEATFKLMISPTPMIGPDDERKTDNHTNFDGFRTERKEFFDWLLENEMLEKNFYLLTGDRHWQYHSIDTTGVEEFSSGALVDENSRMGRKPGDPDSTDPIGSIEQPYMYDDATGGFLYVKVHQDPDPVLLIRFYDDEGEVLHEVRKEAN